MYIYTAVTTFRSQGEYGVQTVVDQSVNYVRLAAPLLDTVVVSFISIREGA